MIIYKEREKEEDTNTERGRGRQRERERVERYRIDVYNSFDPTGTKQTREATKLCQYDIAARLCVRTFITYIIIALCIMDYIIIIITIVHDICPSPVPAMPNTNGVKLCCDVSETKYILILSVYT